MFRGDKKSNAPDEIDQLISIVKKVSEDVSDIKDKVTTLETEIKEERRQHHESDAEESNSQVSGNLPAGRDRDPVETPVEAQHEERFADQDRQEVAETDEALGSASNDELQSQIQECANLRTKQQENESEITTLKDQLSDKLYEASRLQGDLETQKSVFEDAKQKSASQELALYEERQHLTELKKQLGASDSATQEAASERDILKDQLDETGQRLTELQNQLDASQKDQQEAETLQQSLRTELETEAEKNEVLSSESATLKLKIEVDERLEALMWPDFLSVGEMASWRERLEAAIMEDPPVENAVLVTASLFTYNAASKKGKEWHRRLIDVLYEFSQAFFGWCTDLGYNEEQATEEAKKWASSYNSSCEGILKILVPEPDTPFENRTMVSYESGGGGTSRDVKAVKSWCIKDSSGRIMKQAEVTTC